MGRPCPAVGRAGVGRGQHLDGWICAARAWHAGGRAGGGLVGPCSAGHAAQVAAIHLHACMRAASQGSSASKLPGPLLLMLRDRGR